jgi:hypothetical protein
MFWARSIPNDDNTHDSPPCGVDEIEKFHHGTFDADCGSFAAATGRGSLFHSLERPVRNTCICVSITTKTSRHFKWEYFRA